MKKIWLITDGNAGHENQSRGYIKKVYGKDVSIFTIKVKLRVKGFIRNLFKFLINTNFFYEKIFKIIYKDLLLPDSKPDLIISSAGTTAYLSSILYKKQKIKNIYLGFPGGFSKSCFFKVISHYKSDWPNHEYNNILYNLVDTKLIEKKSLEYFQSVDKLPLFVIGGKSRSHRYEINDWINLAKFINQYAYRNKKKVIISTSRRTTLNVEKILIENIDRKIIEKAVWFNHKAEKILLAFYGYASEIFVTQDSLTMISESISTNKRVTVLVPKNLIFREKKEEHYKDFLETNRKKGLIQLKSLDDIN